MGNAVLGEELAHAQPTGTVDEPSPAARDANKKALELSKQGDYEAALVLFQKAYDLSPSYVILYNIGRMSRLTKDYKRALVAYEQYLTDGGDAVQEARRQEVADEIESLTALVGQLDIRINIDGARITVDDVPVGTSPLEEVVPINSGRRRVRASIKGSPPVVKELDVVGGQLTVVELELVEPGDEPPPPPPPDEEFELPTSRWPSAVPISLWVATGLFVGGAAATGTVSAINSKDLEDMVYGGTAHSPPRDSDIQATAERVDDFARATNWLIVGAAVTASAALYTTIAQFTAPDEPAEGQTAPSVRVGVGPSGVTVGGTF